MNAPEPFGGHPAPIVQMSPADEAFLREHKYYVAQWVRENPGLCKALVGQERFDTIVAGARALVKAAIAKTIDEYNRSAKKAEELRARKKAAAKKSKKANR